MTENLQREDLNPIDQAKGILAFFQAKHPDNVYNLDGVMSTLVSYRRRPEDLPEGIAPTVGAIIEISGKSYSTLFRNISLLKLVFKIQEAIVPPMSGLNHTSEKLPLSQGYLFAANLGNPDFPLFLMK